MIWHRKRMTCYEISDIRHGKALRYKIIDVKGKGHVGRLVTRYDRHNCIFSQSNNDNLHTYVSNTKVARIYTI